MLSEDWRKASQQIQRRMKSRRRETLPLPILHTRRVMLPPVPLVLFNAQCKTPLKKLPKPLSLDSLGQVSQLFRRTSSPSCALRALLHRWIPHTRTPHSTLSPCASAPHHPAAPLAYPKETELVSWASPRPAGSRHAESHLAAAVSWLGNHCEWPRRGN